MAGSVLFRTARPAQALLVTPKLCSGYSAAAFADQHSSLRQKYSRPQRQQQSHQHNFDSSSNSTSSVHAADDKSKKNQKVQNIDKSRSEAMLQRDQELLAKLLDREGGEAGISIIDGSYEEGLGPNSKKNMFRLI